MLFLGVMMLPRLTSVRCMTSSICLLCDKSWHICHHITLNYLLHNVCNICSITFCIRSSDIIVRVPWSYQKISHFILTWNLQFLTNNSPLLLHICTVFITTNFWMDTVAVSDFSKNGLYCNLKGRKFKEKLQFKETVLTWSFSLLVMCNI